MRSLFSLAFAASVSLLLKTAAQSAYYVSSSTGSSSNPGTSVAQPSNNLTAVLQRAAPGSTIYLCNGDVFSGGPFVVSTANLKLTAYSCRAGAGNSPPTLTSSINVGTSFQTIVANGVTQHVFDLTNLVESSSAVWSVWVNGRRYMPCRYPNLVDPTVIRGQSRSEFLYLNSTQSQYGNRVMNPSRSLKNLTNYWVGASVRIRDKSWSWVGYNIAEYFSNGTYRLDDNADLKLQYSGVGYFLENVYGELDYPGEFYYNATSKKLYLVLLSSDSLPTSQASPLSLNSGVWVLAGPRQAKPRKNQANIWVTTQMFNNDVFTLRITGQNVSVSGIAVKQGFSGIFYNSSGDWSMTNPSISNCTVQNMLLHGMQLVSSTATVSSSVVSDCDYFGLFLTGYSQEVGASSIQNNGAVAGYNFEGSGIWCLYDCHVHHSVIAFCGFTCVKAGSYAVVEDNNISWPMQSLADTGSVYSWGNQTTGIIIQNNDIVFSCPNEWSHPGKWFMGGGLYMDDNSHNYSLINNRIQFQPTYNCDKQYADTPAVGIKIRNSWDNTFLYNYLYAVNMQIVQDELGQMKSSLNLTFIGNSLNAYNPGTTWNVSKLSPIRNYYRGDILNNSYTSVVNNTFCGYTDYPYSSSITYENDTTVYNQRWLDPPTAGNRNIPKPTNNDCTAFIRAWTPGAYSYASLILSGTLLVAAPVTRTPTSVPTNFPTLSPTRVPSFSPSIKPTQSPTNSATSAPSTRSPTLSPTLSPTRRPTLNPTPSPSTTRPTTAPTSASTTKTPTFVPTNSPTSPMPTKVPSFSPTTKAPSIHPTPSPSTKSPTNAPTSAPSTRSPTLSPTLSPTRTPTTTPKPSTRIPSFQPINSQVTYQPAAPEHTSVFTEDRANGDSTSANSSRNESKTNTDSFTLIPGVGFAGNIGIFVSIGALVIGSLILVARRNRKLKRAHTQRAMVMQL